MAVDRAPPAFLELTVHEGDSLLESQRGGRKGKRRPLGDRAHGLAGGGKGDLETGSWASGGGWSPR